MELSRTERWILANQLLILEKVDPKNATDYARQRDAIESGYQAEYDQIAQHVYRDEETLTAADCSHVIHVLSMYESLKVAYDRLTDKTGIDAGRLTFPGWDGNNETGHMAYARYLVHDKGMFSVFGKTDFNSHMPSVDIYERMLAVFTPFERGGELPTREQIIAVLEARKFPGR